MRGRRFGGLEEHSATKRESHSRLRSPLAPVKGVVAATHEVVAAVSLDPGEGTAGLLVGLGNASESVAEAVGLVLPKEPRAILITAAIHVVHDAKARGEEDGEGGKNRSSLVIEAAGAREGGGAGGRGGCKSKKSMGCVPSLGKV